MDLRLLGPLEVRFEDGPVELGPRKQRAVLAMLALEPGTTVSGDRLAQGLWGDRLPASAPKMIQLYVSRLRRVLDRDDVRIVTHGRGYELQLADAKSVDAVRFERLLGTRPRDALALWHGEALADLTDEPFAPAEIRRLEELRLRATELAIDADLAAGRHAEVIGELDALVVQEPLRERLRAQRMLALYRAGRQAEALEAYRDAREALLDLGIEPGEELHALHQAILEHDPSIAAPTLAEPEREVAPGTAPPPTAHSRRGSLIAAGALAALSVVGGLAVLWPGGEAKTTAVRSNALAEIDAGNGSLGGQALLDGPPSAIAAASGAIWVAGDRDGTVSRIDPKAHTVRQTIRVGHGQSTLAADRGGVWAANRDDGTLSYIPRAGSGIADTIAVTSPTSVCLLAGELWVAGPVAGGILRINPETHARRIVVLGKTPSTLACGAGGVWAVAEGSLIQVDPKAGTARPPIAVGEGVSALTLADGVVWVANPLTGVVSRVDPERRVVTGTFTLGADDEPVALAVGAGGVWVANRRARTVARIDPKQTVGTQEFHLGHDPRALAVVDGRLWVAVAATGPGQRGGTLRVDFQGEADAFVPEDYDPATAYTPWGWQVVTATNDGLTTYRRVGGLAGATLLPNLAESLPAPSDGGRTYAFTLRRGVRFSTGRTVRPSDVKRGIERALHAAPRAGGLLDGIASMTADDARMTIVFRLKRADPDFLYRLAVPFASAVPPGTPAPPTTVAGTGPYRIAGYEPGRSIRLERNRFFRPWSALARPDGYPDVIDARLAVGAKEAIAAVRGGRRDVAIMGTGLDELAKLRRRDPGPIRDAVDAATTWIFLNTRVPPFDVADARRALSLAIDRRPVIAAAGGTDAVRPTCHIIPPGLPGYRSSCPAGGPDLAGARRLVAHSGTRGARVTLWTAPGWEPITPMLTRTLRSLDYRTRVRRLGFDPYFRRVADSDTRSQIGPSTWGSDYPATSSFLDPFSCRSFSPHDRDNPNLSQFCDPRADDLMRRATAVQTTDPRAADVLWARAERQILAGVPVIPVLNPIHTDLVSTRVRNDQYHPQWQLLLDQMSVR